MKMRQVQVGLSWAAAALATFCTTGCGTYHFSAFEDMAIIDNRLYVLANREDGVDQASPFAHSSAFYPTSRKLVIACADLEGKERGVLKVIAKRKVSSRPDLLASVFKLSSTNSIFAMIGDEPQDFIVFGNGNEIQTLISTNTHRVYFSPGRKVMFGLGEPSWGVDAQTFTKLPGSRVEMLSDLVRGEALKDLRRVYNLLIPDNLTFAAHESKDWRVEINEPEKPSRWVTPLLASNSQTLLSVHGSSGHGKMLFGGSKGDYTNPKSFAFVSDMNGKELSNAQMIDPVADADCTVVIGRAIAETGMVHGKTNPYKLWWPDEGREEIFNLDTSRVSSELDAWLGW